MKVWLLIAALTLPLAGYAMAGAQPNDLRTEAEDLFRFDEAHPHTLPAHKIRALSIAIEFRDDVGARQIITELSHR